VSWPANAGHPGDDCTDAEDVLRLYPRQQAHGTLYIGVTNNLERRVWEHKQELVPGFTKKHGVNMLDYFEKCGDIGNAIHSETRLKKYKREWKTNLIQKNNPEWRDLAAG
jgi:putative endonuclease